MTVATTDLQQELKEFTERRRRIENLLATNPDNRAELEGLLVRMLDHEESKRDFLRETDKLLAQYRRHLADQH